MRLDRELSHTLSLVRSRLGVVDLLRESWYSVSRNLGRSVVATLGALLGCAAFVATLGISGTASSQISESFDIRRATEVVASANEIASVTEGASGSEEDYLSRPGWYNETAGEKAEKLSGVVEAGRVSHFSSVEVKRLLSSDDLHVQVEAYSVDADSIGFINPTIVTGRAFDFGHVKRAEPVVLLSSSIATQLNITQPGSAIFIGDMGFVVIGIYDDVERIEGSVAGIILPISSEQSVATIVGQKPDQKFFVQTVPGAALQVAQQLPLALFAERPDAIQVSAPPDPRSLRLEVEESVTQLSLAVSLVALVLGTISIANTTAIGVVLRTGEIGLRRALGASRKDIFLQLLGETSALGLLGGVFGALAGVTLTVGVSISSGWVPLIDPLVVVGALLSGALSGLVAGLWPAFKATRIAPAAALTR